MDRSRGERAVVNLTVQGVSEEQFQALSRQIATGLSGIEFALGAMNRGLTRKIDAIAKKLEDPTSGELAQVLAELKGEADSLEELARKHAQPTE